MRDPADPARIQELEGLLEQLGLEVSNIELVDRALTHASMAAEADAQTYDYESLEFLGDAVLGLAVAHHLFEQCPDRTPGEYSRMRASLVNRRMLARVADRLAIGPVIKLGRGEEKAGGRKRASLLADCLEALIGAVYLDRGWPMTRAFIEDILRDELDSVAQEGVVWDYKSRLQHYCQAERFDLPRFVVVRSEGPDHRKEFEVEVLLNDEAWGRGVGRSKKEAEQAAARVALERAGQLG